MVSRGNFNNRGHPLIRAVVRSDSSGFRLFVPLAQTMARSMLGKNDGVMVMREYGMVIAGRIQR